MSWQTCCVVGCGNQIRAGLTRFGEGGDGQPLADGRTCWRCRRKQATTSSRKEAKAKSKKEHEEWEKKRASRT